MEIMSARLLEPKLRLLFQTDLIKYTSLHNRAFGKPVEYIEFLYRMLKTIKTTVLFLILFKEECDTIKKSHYTLQSTFRLKINICTAVYSLFTGFVSLNFYLYFERYGILYKKLQKTCCSVDIKYTFSIGYLINRIA